MRIVDTLEKPSNRSARVAGQGTAWLLFDAGGDLFQYQCQCNWMGGSGDDHPRPDMIDHPSSAHQTALTAA